MSAAEKESILTTKGLVKAYGALLAVRGVDIHVSKGEFVAIIGPNGAGKTTLFNLLSGMARPTSGQILFKGEDISNLPPYEICTRGMVRTFQITQVFPHLTALENVRLAAQFKQGGNARIIGGKQIIKDTGKKGEEVLHFLGIGSLANLETAHLSHGDQRLVELGMAMVQDPELLLLDEPTAGLSVTETHETVEVLKNITTKRRNTVLLVEHDMDVVFNLASRIIVLNFGEVIAEGSGEDIKANEEVQRAYLGGVE
jgi:branched-chain amino acid transport system ATP-binding protein